MKFSILTLLVLLMLTPKSWGQDTVSKVARQGAFEVKQLVIPGFSELPLSRKLFIYSLTQAMEAGRDIAWQQLSPNGLRIRKLFESIWPRFSELEESQRQALEEYYFLLLFNHGPHDQNSNQKNILHNFTIDEFVHVVLKLGGDTREAMALAPDLLDPEVRRYRVARAGYDKIEDSGTAYYGEGMTEAHLSQMPLDQQRHFLSTPYLDPMGQPQLQFHRIGGRFSQELVQVTHFLKEARAFGNAQEQALIDAYLLAIRTGDPEDQLQAERLWVQYRSEDITFFMGFIETYDDPLEARGTWEGTILLKSVDPVARTRNEVIRDQAVAFEARMPVDPEFKKVGVFTPPQSEGAYMVHFSGGHNEKSFRGVNLPNSAEIRETLGSLSFTAYNKVFDLGGAQDEFEPGALNEYYAPQYHNALARFGRSQPLMMQVEFHEILGHGSGRDRKGVNSSVALGSDYAAMEEARAEVAALYTLTDPDHLHELGILRAELSRDEAQQFAEVTLLEFFTDHLQSYVDLKGSVDIRQAHQLGRQMILNRALNDGALKIHISPRGVPYVVLGSFEQMRASFGNFWADIQNLKSTGDAKGLRELILKLGVMTKPERYWAEALLHAKERLKTPSFTVYLNPRLELKHDSVTGQVSDVLPLYESPAPSYRILFEREQTRIAQDRRRNCETELIR